MADSTTAFQSYRQLRPTSARKQLLTLPPLPPKCKNFCQLQLCPEARTVERATPHFELRASASFTIGGLQASVKPLRSQKRSARATIPNLFQDLLVRVLPVTLNLFQGLIFRDLMFRHLVCFRVSCFRIYRFRVSLFPSRFYVLICKSRDSETSSE